MARTQSVNGSAPQKNDKSDSAKPDEGQSDEQRLRGTLPTMPVGLVYTTEEGLYVACIVHPGGAVFREVGKGQGSAKGALEDSGYILSNLSTDLPVWLRNRLPDDCDESRIVGTARVTGFPLIPQK